MSNALAKRGLTPKQRLFALEWSNDCNATQAAIRASYNAKGAEYLSLSNKVSGTWSMSTFHI